MFSDFVLLWLLVMICENFEDMDKNGPSEKFIRAQSSLIGTTF